MLCIIEQIQALFKELQTIKDSTIVVVTGVDDGNDSEEIHEMLLDSREN